MAASACRQLETRVFRVVNGAVVPAAKAGMTFPPLAPGGILVLETKGRKTGRSIQLPLMAVNTGGMMLVATARAARSEWLRNLAASPDARVWLWGRWRPARAFVVEPRQRPKDGAKMPVSAQLLVGALEPLADLLGVGFAILVPR